MMSAQYESGRGLRMGWAGLGCRQRGKVPLHSLFYAQHQARQKPRLSFAAHVIAPW